jgi:hypothetical protein
MPLIISDWKSPKLVTSLILSIGYVVVICFFGSEFFSGVQAQQVETNPLFPNATTPIPGNQSIVPGLHAMSLVNGIKSTWLIISSDNELSINLRYTGTGTAPPVSLFATALKGTNSLQLGAVPSIQSYQRLTGSNVTNAGWVSPITIPIKLQGDVSLYDADLIIVMIVPYTGANVLPANNTNPSASQGQSPVA